MKFTAHVCWRKDNGEIVSSGLVKEGPVPTLLIQPPNQKKHVEVELSEPFEIEADASATLFETYQALIQDLTRALAIAVRVSPEVRDPIERELANLKFRR